MRKDISFRTRLLLSFWALLLLTLLLPAWYYHHLLSKEIRSESRQSAVHQLNLIHWMLSHEKGITSIQDLQSRLTAAAGQPGTRITFIAEGGKVLADSQVPLAEIPNLENHAGRPEIVEAGDREVGIAIRYSGTVQKDLIYVAKRVQETGVLPTGTLRLALPFSTVTDQLDRLKHSVLFFVLLASLGAVLFSYALVRMLNRPISELIEAAEAISTRDFKRRIHSTPGQEFYPLTQAINHMAESIEKHIQTITSQKQELEAVFNAMREAVMVLDYEGKIRSVNRTFSNLSRDMAEVIGRRPLEVLVNVELQRLCDHVMTTPLKGDEALPQQLQITLGEERTYDVNIVRPPDTRQGMGAVVVFHDISELNRLEKVRQDFVANVSHELRTPLTSIKGYSETLLSETPPPPDTASSFLQVIMKNANHMSKIVDDLLQLARLDARQDSSKSVSVNAASAVMTAWKACAHQAEAKGIRLEKVRFEDDTPVSADFDQLVQVFRNLLENAIRYSPTDTAITVSREDRGDHITFSVRDRGPGILKQHQQRIFERFYRIEKHRSDHLGSTGLGLAICRHIVRNHGGAIWVRSPVDGEEGGTEFLFTLPKSVGVQEEPKGSSTHPGK